VSARRAVGLDAVPGVRVGHWTGETTGVTVVLCPPGTTGSAEVRGGAPATRELAVLEPGRTVDQVDAVVLTGGSVFGLAAADAVVAWLAEHGLGFPTRFGPVPIVPAAAIYDLGGGDPPPGAPEGRRAAEAAAAGGTQERGRVGAGRGATVGKWRGPDGAMPGGLGQAVARVDDATIAALAVANPMGDVIDDAGGVLAGSSTPDAQPFPDPDPFAAEPNTTLVVLATDARCSKADCHLLAQSGHHGVARAIHPSHTRHDGDLVVAVATGTVEVNLDRLRVAAVEVVAGAVRDAVRET
jgi:L-aminopeptidase/D-esterase-like protein